MKLLLPDKEHHQQKDTLPILLPEGESLDGSEQLRKNIDMTKTVNPDMAAENQVLGNQTGLDSDFVSRNHDQVKSEVEVDTIQSKVSNFPGVANYFSERKNVEVSKDDVDNLTETESLFKQYVVDPGSAVLKFAPRAAYTIEGSVSNILALPFGAMDEATKSLEQFTGFGRGGAFGNIRDMFQEHARNMFVQRDRFFAPSEEIRDQRLIENFGLLADPEWVLTNLGDTAASFLPVLVAAVYTGGSSLAGGVVGGGMEGGALYNQMMDEGKVNSATALNAATIFGTASAYLNKIGLDPILDKTPIKGLKDRIFKAIVKGSIEGTTEWLEEPTEALISTIAEGGGTEDVIEAVKEAAKNIEVIPGSFLLGGGTAYMHMGNEYRRIRSAETDAQFFEELDQKATDSKTKSRLPKSYEKAIEAIQREAGGEVENVYIDAVLFQKALDAQPEVSEEILDKIELGNELTEALATGGDISIPISKYATHIAGTDLSINIRPDIHFKQEGMSSREAETARTEWVENMQTQIDEIRSEKESVDAFESERQQVYEDVLQRREATGAVPETVESDAAYWAAFASTYAQRYGGTPTEVYRQIMPEIRAEERFEGAEEGEFIDQEAQAEESFQTAQQDVQQIISREQAPVPSETVFGFAPEVDLAAQRLHDLQLSLKEGDIINFTDPSVLNDVLALAVDRVSGFREGRIGSARANTLKRAQDFVRQNPDIPANYVEIDLRNLGGINEEYGHTAADRIFRSITDIIAKNLNRLGVDNNDFRHGGDEVGSIIIGADSAAIDKVLFDAETEIAEMANNTITPSGTRLSELIHPKHKKDLTRRGTGIIFSSSPVDPDASVRAIFEQADVDVELRKKGLDNEYNRQIEKARALASEGRRRFGRPITEEEIRAQQESGREPEEEIGRRPSQPRLTPSLFQESRGAVSKFELGETPIIKLFETADPSTFLHESGHTFFQFMSHAAVQPDAPQDLIDDWTALREHVGNDGTTPLTNDQHEILTKSLEAYFMEGKAPSARLQDVFQKFSDWLTSLYRQAFNLGVRPTKEVQAIFDRMFATDQEISDINQYYDAQRPFFEEADALTEQDRQRYERLRKKAEVTAEDKRFRRYVKSYVRSLGGKQEIEKQVAEQVNSMPVYTSMDKAVNEGGFFIGDVEELLGKDQRIALSKKRPGMVTIKGEVPIDIVAEENGFDSPTEMLNTMLAAEKKSDLQKKIVDRELVQIEKQIREGLEAADPDAPVADNDYHNDARLAVLAAEAQMLEQRKRLEKGHEKAKVKRVEAKAVRDVAREVLKTKTLNDALGHYKYSRAEAKASRQAREAKDEGDIEAAEKFKRKELLNHALVLEAVKAREAHEKTIRRFARSIKRDIDDRYGNQIVGVLNKFGLTNRTPQEGTKDFATFMEGLTVADADNPMGPTSTPRWNDWAYNNTKVPKLGTTYRTTLTLAEFEELNDIVKWLTETGYDLKKGRLAAYKESMTELVNELIEPSKTLKYKKVRKKGSFLRKLSDNVRRFIADHDMFPFVLDMMDGFTNVGPKGYFGPNRIKIGHVLADRQSARDRRMKSAFEGLDAPISTLTESSKKHSKQIKTTVPVPELINRDGDYWTFEKIISIALNMGNPTNLQRLQDGYGLSMSDLAELTSLLSKEDWKAVQSILDHVDSYWKDLDDVHYRVNHFHQERVKAQSIEVRTSEGDEFTLKGGYYPLKYDSNLAKRVAEWDEKDDLMQDTVWGHPGVKAGHLKSRASNVFLPVNLSLSTLYSHIEDTIHYITHADVIKDIDRVTQSGEYQEAMEDKLGVEVYRLIRPTLRHIARPERALGTFIDKKLDRMRALSTAYILGVNTSVAVKQIFSVPGVIFKTGIGAYTKGIWRVIRNPIEARESMREMSPYMETRGKSFDRDIVDSIGKLRFSGMGLKPGMVDQIRDWSFVLIQMMDFTAVYPAWWGSYKQGLIKENSDPELATRYADEMIRDTQPSTKPMDLSNIQRNRNGLVRAFSMFMTFTAKYGNRQRFHYKGWRQGKIKTTEYGRHLLYEAILPPLLMNMMFAFMWGDERDEKEAAGDILTDIMMYQFSGYVLVRELAGLGGYLVKKYGFEDEDVFKPDVARAPAFEGFRVGQRSAETLIKWLNDMDDDDNYVKAVWAFAEFASFWVGIPAPKLARKLLEGMRQFEEGEGTAFNIAVPNPSKRER